MKDKLLQIRVTEEFIKKLEYLTKIFGFNDNSKTVRWLVEKEYQKENNSKEN